uniref:Tyrosine specific protein phosphatases domain-containing protein n=1 Tax=Hucho hucho TaxID=62062 RepID=A0A4W5MQT1_9TELE
MEKNNLASTLFSTSSWCRCNCVFKLLNSCIKWVLCHLLVDYFTDLRDRTRKVTQTENVRVITMNEEYETKYFCNSAKEWKAEGVEQLRLSTVVLTGVPSLENLHRGVEFALTHWSPFASDYVHCKAGRCRSTTLASAYIIRVSQWLCYLPNLRYHQQVCGGGFHFKSVERLPAYIIALLQKL